METLNLNGIAYHIVSQGQGTPILLLHGFTGSSDNWGHIIPVLAEKYTVIAPDLIGHGKTASPTTIERYHIQNVSQDLVKLVQHISDQPIHLLGYSMGGRLALYLAIHYPHLFKTLILESASAGLANEDEQLARKKSDDALATRIQENGIEAFVAEWENLSLWHTQTPQQKQALRAQRLNNNTMGLANSLRGFGTGVQPSLWEKLATILLPTLFIVGEYDTKFVQIAQQMHQQISHSHKIMIDGVGHTTHLENSSTFMRVVLEFLAIHE